MEFKNKSEKCVGLCTLQWCATFQVIMVVCFVSINNLNFPDYWDSFGGNAHIQQIQQMQQQPQLGIFSVMFQKDLVRIKCVKNMF